MKHIEVVVAPELTPNYQVKEKLVVIIDVFRATTTMVAAMANGINQIKTCLEATDAIALKNKGYLVGGERNGVKVQGMDVDNSPLTFLQNKYAGNKLAMSTTNGTKAVAFSLEAKEIIIGAFVNLDAVVDYIFNSDLDVLLVCAGWKGKISTEDFMFAGAVLARLKNNYRLTDSSEIALGYYSKYKDKYQEQLVVCEHAMRLKKLNKNADVAFCIAKNTFVTIPKYNFELNCFVN